MCQPNSPYEDLRWNYSAYFPPSYSHVTAKREKFFNFCLSEAIPQGVQRTIAPREQLDHRPCVNKSTNTVVRGDRFLYYLSYGEWF